MSELLAQIQSYDVTVRLDGANLLLAPASNLPEEVLDTARANKPQLMAELLADTPPPLTDRQLAQLNKWLDSTGETVEADRQFVIDECQTSKKKRDAYVMTFKLWKQIKSEVMR